MRMWNSIKKHMPYSAQALGLIRSAGWRLHKLIMKMDWATNNVPVVRKLLAALVSFLTGSGRILVLVWYESFVVIFFLLAWAIGNVSFQSAVREISNEQVHSPLLVQASAAQINPIRALPTDKIGKLAPASLPQSQTKSTDQNVKVTGPVFVAASVAPMLYLNVVGGLVLLLLFAFYFWPEIRNMFFPVPDNLAFEKALVYWRNQLALELVTPRERNRFENQSRFCAAGLQVEMRILNWFQRRDEWLLEKLGAQTTYGKKDPYFNDDVIVGLLAWITCGGKAQLLLDNPEQRVRNEELFSDEKLVTGILEFIEKFGVVEFDAAYKRLLSLYWETVDVPNEPLFQSYERAELTIAGRSLTAP